MKQHLRITAVLVIVAVSLMVCALLVGCKKSGNATAGPSKDVPTDQKAMMEKGYKANMGTQAQKKGGPAGQ